MQGTATGSGPRYGFYDRLSAVFPSQVLMDITEICNLACTHCPHPQFKQSELYGARHLAPELNAKMADEVGEHGRGITQYIRYTSLGEPTLHPQIYEMLSYTVQRAGVPVSLTTNGVGLVPKNIERLLDTGIDMVDISIDAHLPETYAVIRVNGKLDVTRGNVVNLLRARDEARNKLKIVVSFVEQPQNRTEIEPFKEFWQAQGADEVVIRRLHSSAGASQTTAAILWQQVENQPRRPCVYPWERISINPLGQLNFCPVDWVHGAAFADYRATSIYETWQGEYYQKLRQAHLDNDYTRHKFCGQCPDWQITRWPNDPGRSYAEMIAGLNLREASAAGGPAATP